MPLDRAGEHLAKQLDTGKIMIYVYIMCVYIRTEMNINLYTSDILWLQNARDIGNKPEYVMWYEPVGFVNHPQGNRLDGRPLSRSQ